MFTVSSQPLIVNINNFQLYCYKYDNSLYYLYFHFIHDNYGWSEIFKLKDVKFINFSFCGLHLDVIFKNLSLSRSNRKIPLYFLFMFRTCTFNTYSEWVLNLYVNICQWEERWNLHYIEIFPLTWFITINLSFSAF